jgi:predicted O-methyltransferase YrrM
MHKTVLIGREQGWRGLLPDPQTEYSAPTSVCKYPQLWQMYGQQAAEVEVCELLYSLVRVSKPLVIVETGTHQGISTCYLAAACAENNWGTVLSAEVDAELCDRAHRLLELADLNEWATVYVGTGLSLIREQGSVDLAFLDSHISMRVQEFEAVWPKVTPGGLVVVHDTSEVYDKQGGPGDFCKAQLYYGHARGLVLNTPRGACVFEK